MSTPLRYALIVSICFACQYTNTFVYAGTTSKTYEAEKAINSGGASTLSDNTAAGKSLIYLETTGQKLTFTNLPKAETLAIKYASTNVGTISVVVNQRDSQQKRSVNIHSSGAFTGSFLYAIIEVAVTKGDSLEIYLDANDVAVCIDYIILGNRNLGLPPDSWNLPELPVAKGIYPATWDGISRLYTVPDWWREAKFGAWSHWDPQSVPEDGDWYARGMYVEGNAQNTFHVTTYGHPSEYGYKDICNNWVVDRWNPEALMNLYVDMGARYFVAMGVHHDNFDCWNSTYQPWNSVRVGPKKDIVGIWEKVARQHGLRFGIGFHNTPARTWGQFMTARYTSDKKGAKQGVPYDALQTILDGKGKWWEGMDPVDLYGPVHDKKNPLNSPFANQFMWRVDDAITKYHPDMIYFDEHAGDSQVDLGVNMGLGFLAPPLIANYYNKSLQWNKGKMDVVINLKGVGGRYNSFQKKPELLPLVNQSLVRSNEFDIEPEITPYPFQTETSIADWHYKTGQKYMDAQKVIELLLQNVSRNGTMLLNLTQHGRGDLDPELIQIANDIGAWLNINGEAVYGSRPFEVCGDKTVSYTRNKGFVYATVFNWNDGITTLQALRSGGTTLGKVTKVELIGSNVSMRFTQDEKGLTIIPESTGPVSTGITNSSLAKIANPSLAQKCRVLRITHDKGWFNDDDPGVKAPGWFRYCNLGTGDFNNDLTVSETTGDVWRSSFTGKSVTVITPKEAGAGTLEVQLDGKTRAIVDLATTGKRAPQQEVFKLSSLRAGKHQLSIIHRGAGKVTIDALIIN